MTGMQNAPPVLPSRGAASIHRSSMARSTRLPSCGLNSPNASRTMSSPSFQLSSAGATGSGATRSAHCSPSGVPCRRAFTFIQRRKSGSESRTAVCIASNVGRPIELANSEASSGLSQLRRRLTMFASPLIAFIAAAHGTATRGHASRSAAYATRRTNGSPWVASPRTAGIGRRSVVPSGNDTSAVSCDVTSDCRRPQADEATVPSWA